MSTPKPPATFLAALYIILFIALFWFGFALLVAMGAHSSYTGYSVFRWIMVALALLTAFSLAGLYFFLKRRSRLAYFLAVAFLLLLVLLTAADDLGWADLAVLIVTAVPFILLLINRKWYFQSGWRVT